MLFSTFQAAVNACMGPEAQRRGLEAFRAQHIVNAMIDLARYIPSYRLGNSTVFTAANMTVESKAMLGLMPVGAKPKAFYIYSTGPNDDPNCKRYKLDRYPWARRHELVCGQLDFHTWWGGCCWGPGGCPPLPPAPPVDPTNPNPWGWCDSRAYVYAISPHQDNFLIYPPLNPYDSLLLVWDGYKTVFNPTDVIPYPMEASEAVSSYVLSKIHKLIDRDSSLAADDMQSYVLARRALIREYRENLVADGEDDEYSGDFVPPPGESFVAAGAEAIVFLQNITALLGTAANCLQAIVTSSPLLTGPLTVAINIGGPTQLWTLKTGADPTDAPNGIIRAGDWAISGLVWYQSQP